MKIAVVILNWNGTKLLEQFLPSIVKYSAEADIYVADNASTDNSVAFVKANFPSIKIIANQRNFGFAQGYNEALTHIDADIFALVNSDIEVTENWLKPILETFKNEPKTAVVQPKILDYKNKEYFEYAGAAGGFIDQYGYPFCRGRIFETVEKDQGQYDDDCEIFWASGACFCIRSSVYNQLHGFDTDFFAHQEEIDLCWRIFNSNYTIKYNSKSVVYHVGGATLDKANPEKTKLNFRNSLLMLIKNAPQNKLFSMLFVRLILDGIAAIHFFVTNKQKHSWAILKAHIEFYSLFRHTYKKRGEYQAQKYYKTKNIVYLYFITKIKLFSSIFGHTK